MTDTNSELMRDEKYWIAKRAMLENTFVQLVLRTKKKTRSFVAVCTKLTNEMKKCTEELNKIKDTEASTK